MGILDIFRRKTELVETRSSGSGYTAQIMSARESYISGVSGLGELCATVQACVSLWTGALAAADVTGTDYLDRRSMALAARALALRGEAVFLIRPDRLVACSDWDLSTRDGIPRAYRISISEAGGGRTETVLAPEVLHFRLASDVVAPWSGQSVLRRSQITAQLMQVIEETLRETYQMAPIGSQVVPFPESPDVDMTNLARDFRGRRGRVLLRESVNVAAAGGPAPNHDWKPQALTPDLEKAVMGESLDAAKAAICMAFGVLPGMFNASATGPLIREGQRHLATWMLQPLAMMMAEECTDKLGGRVEIDTLRPLQAYDAGGRARAFSGMIEGLAKAKEAGLTPGEVTAALNFVDLE
ncbi:MAG: phage portal protein [Rhodobacteraceae bacterium]|nr:phage portal protein [Paracoccaceae bacterium]